jgi:hypothetical protein
MVLISRYWAMVGRDMLTIPAPKDHRNMPATTVHNTVTFPVCFHQFFQLSFLLYFFIVTPSAINNGMISQPGISLTKRGIIEIIGVIINYK